MSMRTTTRFCVVCGAETEVPVDSDNAWGEYRCISCPRDAKPAKRAAKHHQPGRLELACQQEISRRRQRREHLAEMWACPVQAVSMPRPPVAKHDLSRPLSNTKEKP
jgi:hypothetical protein